MKRMIVLAILMGALGASAATYYVSPDLGDDSRDGTTMATAFQSLSKVFGNHGILVTHPNARRRFSGAAPDIGCFEYRHPKGAAFFVR